MLKGSKDTLRVVITDDCNLNCSYCCNQNPELRKQFTTPTWGRLAQMLREFPKVIITGGEPLIHLSEIERVAFEVGTGQLLILNTNGLLLERNVARWLFELGVRAINVGLHEPTQFDTIIERVREATRAWPLAVRFNVQSIYRNHPGLRGWPGLTLSYWDMDQCDRPNEVRVRLPRDPPRVVRRQVGVNRTRLAR